MHFTKLQLPSVLALAGTQLNIVSVFAHTFLAINILMFTYTNMCMWIYVSHFKTKLSVLVVNFLCRLASCIDEINSRSVIFGLHADYSFKTSISRYHLFCFV